MDQAARGAKALEAKEYDLAIKEYTAAIAQAPKSPLYHAQRSQAYQRSGSYSEALKDADKAVVFAKERAKRELIIDAQYKRAVALFNLGRFADALFLLEIVKRMDEKHKMVDMTRNRATSSMAKLQEGDVGRQVTVEETPNIGDYSQQAHLDTQVTNGAKSENTLSDANSSSTTAAAAQSAPPKLQQTPADKVRHEWYQSNENVYFTLLAKGVPKEKCVIDISQTSLAISFPIEATGSSYDLTLDPLFAPVVPAKCIPRVLSTKVEVVLVKATAGQKWSALESSEPAPSIAHTGDNGQDAFSDEDVKRVVLTARPQPPTGPAYPTSSKSGPKNWDKIQLDDADDKGGDETNDFFKMLYKDASPEVQRAMIKSYTESNGTALSTNWEEVSKGKVETVPPDGMEARKYEN